MNVTCSVQASVRTGLLTHNFKIEKNSLHDFILVNVLLFINVIGAESVSP